MIPVYMIVAGCAPLLLVFFPLGDKPKKEVGAGEGAGEETGDVGKSKAKSNVCTFLGAVGAMFNVAWLICGTVWVAGKWETVNSGCPGRTDCCNLGLMRFALGTVVIDWVLVGLIVIAACISSFFLGTATVSPSESNTD